MKNPANAENTSINSDTTPLRDSIVPVGSACCDQLARSVFAAWKRWLISEDAANFDIASNHGFAIPVDCCPGKMSATLSLPRILPHVLCEWIGCRLFLWSGPVCERKRISLVSSRLTKRKDLHSDWYSALRTAVLRIDANGEALISVDRTSTSAAVLRASELFGVSCLRLIVSEGQCIDERELSAWIRAEIHQSNLRKNSDANVVRVSPELCISTPTQSSGDTDTEIPIVDRAAFALAERLLVLSCRPNGHIESLTKRHLRNSHRRSCHVLAASNNGRSIPAQLIDEGVIPWILTSTDADTDRGSLTSDPELTPSSVVPGVELLSDNPLTSPDDWLCHWTRPCFGPWQGQPVDEYLDELILGCKSADRSGIAALLRMISTGCIQASSPENNHGGCVSFTAVPLREFRQRRIFRRHRQRYDFEPRGIAIRRSTLVELGARPVEYPTFEDYQQLQDRRWYQPATDARGRLDWTTEREWRLYGEVDLATLKPTDVCIFVDSEDEQQLLTRHTDWTVFRTPDQ
ncbi:MAG: hypothetical protein KDA81_04385 [Planctomycetaceae bacterium]|nr:hypothetical protein [Planctomycetaceae bacterium]